MAETSPGKLRLERFWRLERAHNLSRNTRDADRWTAEEWLRLGDAYHASEIDFTPCQWTEEQVAAALAYGEVPRWDEDLNPIAPLSP